MFPIFLKLDGKRCLVVGAGSVAEGKIKGLLAAGASVHVVAPEATLAIQKWAWEGVLSWRPGKFQATDLDGMLLAVAATFSPELNSQIFKEAQARRVLCNAVDDPQNCDFYYPAVVRRGHLQIAISTNGRSPALAQRLRHELEEQFGPEYETWLAELGEAREQLMTTELDIEARRKVLHELASREGLKSRKLSSARRSD
jgi:precorrin-2 dehydrogenase / sirohydrochlorin ferrochelatase